MSEETLQFESARLLSQLYCGKEENLKRVEAVLDVRVTARDDKLILQGENGGIAQAARFFDYLNRCRSQGINLQSSDFEKMLEAVRRGDDNTIEELLREPMIVKIRNRSIVPKTINQKRYLRFINRHDIVFGIGPAGTGKTYLAAAAATQALLEKKVSKLIISRPAVEAGEALGFLPGDLTEKIEPYLRPIYDAMYDLLGAEDTMKLMDKGVVEIAPLAYMRGRTLSDAFILLDEAQNTTPEQMMMFLTRLGENSRMIITGDITQVDLPKSKSSGLRQAVQVLGRVEGIKFFYFEHADVVRHPLVSRIIKAYEEFSSDNP